MPENWIPKIDRLRWQIDVEEEKARQLEEPSIWERGYRWLFPQGTILEEGSPAWQKYQAFSKQFREDTAPMQEFLRQPAPSWMPKRTPLGTPIETVGEIPSLISELPYGFPMGMVKGKFPKKVPKEGKIIPKEVTPVAPEVTQKRFEVRFLSKKTGEGKSIVVQAPDEIDAVPIARKQLGLDITEWVPDKVIIPKLKPVTPTAPAPEVTKVTPEAVKPVVPPVEPPIELSIAEVPKVVEKGARALTPEQTERTLNLFKRVLLSPKGEEARTTVMALRKEALSKRIQGFQSRMEQLTFEGKDAETAFNIAKREAMSGRLPFATLDTLQDLTDAMRNVLFSKVYKVLANEPFEQMATMDALTNALAGNTIPRIVGIKGGSAYTRLQRVFADQPEILKAIDQKKPLRDIVEGIFHETGIEPATLDPDMLAYLRGLGTKGEQKGLLGRIAGEPVSQDARTQVEKAFALRKMQAQEELLKHGINKPPAQYEFPIEKAIKQPSLIPVAQQHILIRGLKELGLSSVDIGNAVRAVRTSFDWSWWRQQAPMILGHPRAFIRANIEAWHALWSDAAAKASWQSITNDPLYAIYERVTAKGGDFLRPPELPKGAPRYKGVEEFGFLQGTDRPIPNFVSKLWNVKVSQRVFVTGANKHNWLQFKSHYASLQEVSERIASGARKLKPGEVFSIEKGMEAHAGMLADMTGRASLGNIGNLAPIANSWFFALRYRLGKLFMPRHLVSADPYVRKDAWRNLVSYTTGLGSVVVLGKQLGLWDVGTDPQSADFGDIIIGKHHINPWGAERTWLVFLTRIITKTGISPRTGEEYKVDPAQATMRLLRGMVSPLPSIFMEFWTGKTFLGDDVDVKNFKQWVERLAPFTIADLYDAMDESGIAGLGVLPPAMLGAGVSTYEPESRKPRPRPEYKFTPGGIGGYKFTPPKFAPP